jgi:glutamate-1-semialdehyde 2,1-aminomutase
MAKVKTNTKNKKLCAAAGRVLVGGVDSPVRSFGYAGTNPVLIKRGRGAKVYDYDGRGYIDYVLSWGSAILGHAHPSVVNDVRRTVGSGLSFGATNRKEIELAEVLSEAIPFIDKVRFTSSGTEAVMGAIRLARGYTKKDKMLKFENSYHGHADYLLAKGGSGLATLGIPSSAGVPRDFTRHTFIAPYGDTDHLTEIFKRHGSTIAAVIVEPVGGNHGVTGPDYPFLDKLRLITKRYGSLLIFDEVITGFRFRYGALAQKFRIVPDLICLGKIIGGGLPIGAYCGNKKVMNNLAPIGNVYQASTFAGNPVTMQAGLSTLKALKRLRHEYEDLEGLTRYLAASLKSEANSRAISINIERYGNIFSIKFKEKKHFRLFYRGMLSGGVLLAPSEFEANFLSFAHTKKDIENTITAARAALDKCVRRQII